MRNKHWLLKDKIKSPTKDHENKKYTAILKGRILVKRAVTNLFFAEGFPAPMK